MKNIIQALLAVFLLASCEDKIELDIPADPSQLVVEGRMVVYTPSKFLKNTSPDNYCSVKLSLTNGFKEGQNPKVNDATVVIAEFDTLPDLTSFNNLDTFDIISKAKEFETLELVSDGEYQTKVLKGKLNKKYVLGIFYKGETYISIDSVNRVPFLDSIAVENRSEPLYGRAPGYYLNLLAQDIVGEGDFYRIKTFKNYVLFNRPSDINLAYDAGFNPFSGIDGTKFVFPIAVANVNPGTNVTDDDSRGDKSSFVQGDTARVEIWSLSLFGIFYYEQLRRELTNEGLFARPTANIRTNIINTNSKGTQAVGSFLCSAVSGKDVIIK
jgi:hypothetical protein